MKAASIGVRGAAIVDGVGIIPLARHEELALGLRCPIEGELLHVCHEPALADPFDEHPRGRILRSGAKAPKTHPLLSHEKVAGVVVGNASFGLGIDAEGPHEIGGRLTSPRVEDPVLKDRALLVIDEERVCVCRAIMEHANPWTAVPGSMPPGAISTRVRVGTSTRLAVHAIDPKPKLFIRPNDEA